MRRAGLGWRSWAAGALSAAAGMLVGLALAWGLLPWWAVAIYLVLVAALGGSAGGADARARWGREGANTPTRPEGDA